MSIVDIISELKENFRQMENEISWIEKLNDYLEKIYEDEATVELLRNASQYFFADVNFLFLESFYLAWARLTDPYKQGKNKNFTLQYFITRLDEFGKDVTELRSIYKEIEEFTDQIKDERNKIIAHRDLGRIMSREERKNLFSHGEAQKAMENVYKFMDELANQLSDEERVIVPKEQGVYYEMYQAL